MEAKVEGVIASLKQQGFNQGIDQGERNIIVELLKNFSVDEISSMIGKEPAEIYQILDSD